MKTPAQGQSVQLTQTQTLTVTPQMAQRLQILQCNQQQLQVEVQQMLDKNIMLLSASELEFERYSESDNLGSEDSQSLEGAEALSEQVDADIAWEDVYDDDYLTCNDRAKKMEVDSFQEDWVADDESFDQRLERAIFLSPLTPADQQLAYEVLGHLDENYFLLEPVEALAKTLRVAVARLRHVVDTIKHLDPTGVASANVRECLLAQLQVSDDNSDAAVNAKRILSEYFDYIDKKPGLIRSRLLLHETAYRQAMRCIRALSPYPNPAATAVANRIVPEVFVRQRMGLFYASPNQDARFDLDINHEYAALTEGCQGDEKRFMRAQLQEAKFFLDSLHQRQKTIVRVANAIVMEQQDYFIEGDKAMRPLSIQTIAEQLGLSNSTVSRTVRGKYLSFNQRLIELRFFFGQGVSSSAEANDFFADDEVATSATAVKAHIKEIIAAEPPKKPLSDAKIAVLLAERDVTVSRRTVAKYRESMGIAKTSVRKRAR